MPRRPNDVRDRAHPGPLSFRRRRVSRQDQAVSRL
jgi:hypothetical protein